MLYAKACHADATLFCAKARDVLPTAHMGGVGGFTSLADGIDRALAGAPKYESPGGSVLTIQWVEGRDSQL